MLSFREYLDRGRLKKHVKHHNTTKALTDAFPGEELDKAKDAIYTSWGGSKKDGKSSLRKFISDDDRKWAKLWGKVRADCDGDHK